MIASALGRLTSTTGTGRRLIAAGVTAALLLSACSGAGERRPEETAPPSIDTSGLPPKTSPDRPRGAVPPVQPEGFTEAPAGAGAERYRDQSLDWNDCETFQCTSIKAPLDRTDPDGQAITVSMLKVPATEEPRLGTLFVNRGGPGEPGQDLARSFERKGLEQYDIVGWDPRGTGESTPVVCADDAQLDAYYAQDQSPDDQGEVDAYREANVRFGQACLEGSGKLLQHIGTDDTVADLELLRHLVGDEKLHFLGYSYGTDLGSAYAQAHPDRVGKLVLDSAVDISGEDQLIQASGFDRALGNFADWCAGQGCELGRSRDQVIDSVRQVLTSLDQKPLPVGRRMLSQSLGLSGVLLPLYSKQSWPYLRSGVQAAREGDGTVLLELADLYNGRDGADGFSTRLTAFTAIRCVDEPDRGLAGADALARQARDKAPVFGPYLGPDYACATWPAVPRPEQPLRTAKGAQPILVVGTTGDSATPYEYAVQMAEQLQSGVLLTNKGEGHTAYGSGSRCVDKVVVDYFTGEPPSKDLTCG